MKKRKILILLFIAVLLLSSCAKNEQTNSKGNTEFTIISGSENKIYEKDIVAYGKKHGIQVNFVYAGTLDIMDQINEGSAYDAVWSSNSIWLYMLNNPSMIKNSKFTSITPVVFAVDKTKAKELGYVDTQVNMSKIVADIKNNSFRFIMPSVTQTNAGASFYLGMLSTLAGNPQILTSEHLKNINLQTELLNIFKGVNRTAGDEDFLQELYMTGNYDAVVSYESSIIELNKKLVSEGKEPLYLIYPTEGVSLSDSPFAYVDRGQKKEEAFSVLQSYLLGKEMQKKFEDGGRRVWYGGTKDNVDKKVFNTDWGIDTNKFIQVTKYPSVNVIKESMSLYQQSLRKPTHIIFCLDYSGSMDGDGNAQLVEAMHYILTKEQAGKNYIEFSKSDKITIIPFDTSTIDIITTSNGEETKTLLDFIDSIGPYGGTNIYYPSVQALKILRNEDAEKYNLSIVLMTDGNSNNGKFEDLKQYYNTLGLDIPIYSIMFGDANDEQLKQVAELTNGKVFDGRTNLLDAFKKVRGYN